MLLVPGGRITLIKIPLWGSFPARIHSRLADKVTRRFWQTNQRFSFNLNPISWPPKGGDLSPQPCLVLDCGCGIISMAATSQRNPSSSQVNKTVGGGWKCFAVLSGVGSRKATFWWLVISSRIRHNPCYGWLTPPQSVVDDNVNVGAPIKLNITLTFQLNYLPVRELKGKAVERYAHGPN